MHRRWRHEIALAMRYAAVEAEALGAPVAFFEDGPPNVGGMLVRRPEDAATLRFPAIAESAPLQASLRVVEGMKAALQGEALVAGVAVGPLSWPVMLMGMEHWLLMLLNEPERAESLVQRCQDFALRWAEVQVRRGADLLVWFEPLVSTELLPKRISARLARPALAAACGLGAPVVLHQASARVLPRVELARSAGVAALSMGKLDDVGALRAATEGEIALVGGLEGIGLSNKTAEGVRQDVAELRRRFPDGPIMSDFHGEFPWQVDPTLIDAAVEAARA